MTHESRPAPEPDRPDEQERRRRVLDSMAAARGERIGEVWQWVADVDIDFLERYAPLSNASWQPPFGRVLEPKYRELVTIVVLCTRGIEWSLDGHLRRALRLGATPREILEFLEATVLPGGTPILQIGVRHLMEVLRQDEAGGHAASTGRTDP